MSLFIAHLAFEGLPLLFMAKIGILIASCIAGVIGWVILQQVCPVLEK
jgi:Na+/H+ antiporter NhaA